LFDPFGGYLESGKALAAMAELARADGVVLRESSPVRAVDDGMVRLDGEQLGFDRVVVAAGVWTPRLVPGIPIRPTLQSMAFFEPDDAALHAPGPMAVFATDMDGEDGWYGHPLPDGRVKIADGPLGPAVDPDDERTAP